MEIGWRFRWSNRYTQRNIPQPFWTHLYWWNGFGGEWLDVGFPTYKAIDRKPENGCEIKTSSCARIGIMMRFIVVKPVEENAKCDEKSGINHGAAMTRRLVEPWKNWYNFWWGLMFCIYCNGSRAPSHWNAFDRSCQNSSLKLYIKIFRVQGYGWQKKWFSMYPNMNWILARYFVWTGNGVTTLYLL